LSHTHEAAPSPDEPQQPPSEETFESSFEELQRVVEQLESGGLDLDRVVDLYDRGISLAQTCERMVADAELRVTRLTAEMASPLSDA
jgi:exodeoxyribonuclease VII small subunit